MAPKSRQRTLADDIADLLNPMAETGWWAWARRVLPEVSLLPCMGVTQITPTGAARDPDEVAGLGDGAAVLESDEELAAAANLGRAGILPDIVMEGKTYAGKRTSRRNAFEEEDSNEEEIEESDTDGLEDVSDEEGESSSPSDADEPGDEEGRAAADSDSDDVYRPAGARQAEAEIEALERAIDGMQEDEGSAATYLAGRAEAELRRARAVQAQRKLWDASLELRILLQRLLKAAVRMPQVSPELLVDWIGVFE